MGIENKEIQIQEAIQGERVIDNTTVNSPKEFIKALKIN